MDSALLGLSTLEAAFKKIAEAGAGKETVPVGNPMEIWRDAKANVDTGIDQLQKSLKGIDHPDLNRIAEMGLNGITDGNQVALMKALFRV